MTGYTHRLPTREWTNPRAARGETGASTGSCNQWMQGKWDSLVLFTLTCINAWGISEGSLILQPHTLLYQCVMCCCLCVSEERPSLHHPPGCEWPHVCAAFLVPHSCLIRARAQGSLAAQNDPAVPDCNDPPSALQQPSRGAGGDPDSTG